MNIIRLIKKVYLENLQVPAGDQMDERILGDSLKAMKESRVSESPAVRPNMWRIIMKSRITKAAAAVIVIAGLVAIGTFSASHEPEVPTKEYAGDDAANPSAPAVDQMRGRMRVAKDNGSAPALSAETALRRWSPDQEQFQALASGTVLAEERLEAQEKWDGECRPELTEGASGKGYYFDGNGDYILIPAIEGLGVEQTKMLWVNIDPSPRPHFVYLMDQDQGRHVGCNNWVELVDNNGNGAPNIRAGFDGSNFFDSKAEIEVGYWYHITVASTSAGDVYTYINGVFDSSRSGLSTSNQPHGILIGGTSSSQMGNFKGFIDEVAIFNRALYTEEIWQIYQNTGRLRGNEPGLVGYWNFDYDHGDVVKDSSPYSNDATLSQGLIEIPEEYQPEPVEGVSGNAYYFDGLDDYVDCGSLGSFPSRGTITFWMEADEIANYRNPLTTDFGGSNAGVRFEEDGNGRFVVVIRTSESPTDPGVHEYLSSGLRANTWYNVVLVWDSDSDNVRGYINGADKFDESQIEWPSTLPDVQIGRGYSISPSRHWSGTIDEVAIFNRPLSADEIRRLYQNPGSLRGNEAGLVAYWSFDNDEGELVKDDSPYGNHGTLGHERGHSAPEPAEPEPPVDGECRPELTEGASGYGYYFDGDGDYIEIPPIEGLGAEHTKMLWTNPDASPRPDYVYLIDQDQGKYVGNNNWIELVRTDEKGSKIRTGYDSGNFFDSEGRIQLGYWNHVAVVSTSAGEVRTYINGLFDSSHSGFSVANAPEGILIGATSSDRRCNFKGIIDEVAFFNRALSDKEIWNIYQNTGRLSGNELGLVGYWNFDRDDGDTVRDMSRYGNNGKLGPVALPPPAPDVPPLPCI